MTGVVSVPVVGVAVGAKVKAGVVATTEVFVIAVVTPIVAVGFFGIWVVTVGTGFVLLVIAPGIILTSGAALVILTVIANTTTTRAIRRKLVI